MEGFYADTARRVNERNSEYLAGINAGKIASSREQYSVQLRRRKRTEMTNKRRMIGKSDIIQNTAENIRRELISYYNSLLSQAVPDIVKQEYLVNIRTYSCDADKVTPYHFLELGYIPLFIHLLAEGDRVIQREAAWVLCNIALGDTHIVAQMITFGIVEAALKLIDSPSSEVTQNVLWCLGNMAGDSLEIKRSLISKGLLESILCFLVRDCALNIELFKVVAWTLLNLTTGKYLLSLSQAERTLRTVTSFFPLHDKKLTLYALKILTNISQGDQLTIDLFISSNKVPEILSYIDPSAPSFTLAALKTTGNLITGKTRTTQYILDHNIIERTQQILSLPDARVRKEAHWILSNIAAGSMKQRCTLLAHDVLHVALCGLHDTDTSSRLESSWLYANLVRLSSPEARELLVRIGLLPHLQLALCLRQDNEQYLKNLLFICSCVLQSANAVELFAESGCLESLEKLGAETGCKLVSELLEEYFGDQSN